MTIAEVPIQTSLAKVMAELGDINTATKLLFLFSIVLACHISGAWIHNLKLQDDNRQIITPTRLFGFLKNGTLTVNISMFSCNNTNLSWIDQTFGFTLDKSRSPGIRSYMGEQGCAVNAEASNDKKRRDSSVIFRFELQRNRVTVDRGSRDLANLTIVQVKNPAQPSSTVKPVQPVQSSSTVKPVQPDLSSSTVKPVQPVQSSSTVKPVQPVQSSSTVNPVQPVQSSSSVKPELSSPGAKSGKNHEDATRGLVKRAPEMKNPQVNAASNENSITKQPAQQAGEKLEEGKNLELNMTRKQEGPRTVFQLYFQVQIQRDSEEGLYSLTFHNCDSEGCAANLDIQIIQDNNGNYLSADEMPIPTLYFIFSVIFFVLTLVWFSVLRRAKDGVYKIHYLMLAVVFFRGLSDLFHGVNMLMIQKSGIHVDAWAILWYIVYLMRGAVMFVTVLLIGAGWAFIKHVFSDREKKLFLIVIPLQILMNVAWVIVEESEEGYSSYNTWHGIFIGVDLLCCLAILFPVIWSVRHLQEASRTDGKAAINLNKLKLFKQFYIMIVAFIYFTRIIGYLLLITLPFRYGWMKDLFEEVFLFFFFSLTGYNFRPASDNPYLQVPQDSDDEDIEMDEVVTKTGNMESLVRVNQGKSESRASNTVSQRESSHEYD